MIWTLTTPEPVGVRADEVQIANPGLAALGLTQLLAALVARTGAHSTLKDQFAFYELALLLRSNVRFGLFICAGGMRSSRR